MEFGGLNNTAFGSAKIKKKGVPPSSSPAQAFLPVCWGYVQRSRFAKSRIIMSAVCNRIQGGNSARCFCWCHKTQKHNSRGAAESWGWNCSPWTVLRMGPCFANQCSSATFSILNLKKRKSGCKCSCGRSYWWQRTAIWKYSQDVQAEIYFGQGNHAHACKQEPKWPVSLIYQGSQP